MSVAVETGRALRAKPGRPPMDEMILGESKEDQLGKSDGPTFSEMGTSPAYLVARLDRQQVFPERLTQIWREPVTRRAAGGGPV